MRALQKSNTSHQLQCSAATDFRSGVNINISFWRCRVNGFREPQLDHRCRWLGISRSLGPTPPPRVGAPGLCILVSPGLRGLHCISISRAGPEPEVLASPPTTGGMTRDATSLAPAVWLAGSGEALPCRRSFHAPATRPLSLSVESQTSRLDRLTAGPSTRQTSRAECHT